MPFNDTYVSREKYFTLGIDSETGGPYLSFPVDNGLVEYSEYYSIPKQYIDDPATHMQQILDFLKRARNHELDELLIMKPGRVRGAPIGNLTY